LEILHLNHEFNSYLCKQQRNDTPTGGCATENTERRGSNTAFANFDVETDTPVVLGFKFQEQDGGF
jgi:hypothetical protein